ncbi:palmitoyltransferase ZDHHC23-B-like [Amphibalanus amphitrite]|uniref:palmitoyltransferase ZDHHC23-B-like n=1 Tax=Amphibalanus amphitrite TaxID=1232801 RepID=UPI001C925BE6|nr:palmitoyltransferase ZDHHC23-B-like [Amphibalanus amphitrite]XP_043223673.1 palmitoyltransferase ZDHHC23-B-like [Amphibalanus amphitrite]XP_043223674.1 palmitoyltransferase ZDHHC23-B-like [Amphibalanus amphitrite]
MAKNGDKIKMTSDQDPLCCCEYINIDGERSHLLALCCDCEAIDDTVDRWLKGVAVPESSYSKIWSTMTDRLRIPWFGGARQCPWEVLIPAATVPLLMLFASLSMATMMCSLAIIPLILLISRVVLRHQPKSLFYYIWTCSSFFTLFYIFEFYVVPMLLISFYEHLIFAALLAAALLSWYRVRSRRGFCQPSSVADAADTFCELCEAARPARAFHCVQCERCVLLRDHHCAWLDCCVGGANQRPFVFGLASVALAMAQAAWLTVACVCPGPLTPWLVLTCRPESTAGAAALFGALYALVCAVLCSAVLAHQCLLISLGQTGCERRRQLTPPGPPAGLLVNWYRFLTGRDEPTPEPEH